MATEQELADMERMSNDYVPDAKVLEISYTSARMGLISLPGTTCWRTAVNAGIGQ